MCVCVCVCVCLIRSPGWRIHGGVEDTKFSTNKQLSLSLSLSLCVCVCVCIYIHTYIQTDRPEEAATFHTPHGGPRVLGLTVSSLTSVKISLCVLCTSPQPSAQYIYVHGESCVCEHVSTANSSTGAEEQGEEEKDLSQRLRELPYVICCSVSTSPLQSSGHEAKVSIPSHKPFPQHAVPAFSFPARARTREK